MKKFLLLSALILFSSSAQAEKMTVLLDWFINPNHAPLLGVLNSMGHFLLPVLAPCVLNIALISASLLAIWQDGNVAVWLAWGVLAAGLGQWLLQQPVLRRKGFFKNSQSLAVNPVSSLSSRLIAFRGSLSVTSSFPAGSSVQISSKGLRYCLTMAT